jgi:site-specific DNA-adenine methylase
VINKIGLSNPYNYTGSKHRYLGDLFEALETFPKHEALTVVDPFVGGGDLCCHLPEGWKVDAFDLESKLIGMHEMFNGSYGGYAIEQLDLRIKQMGLSRTNEDAYERLKAMYNQSEHEDSHLLYLLICHSNSNRMRFSKKSGFNLKFGKRTFNPSMKAKVIDYVDRLSKRNVTFQCKSYHLADFGSYDLTLLDPPYLNTTATYNEGGGWTLEDELALHAKIEKECKKFVYFGQLWSKGVYNEALDMFAQDYNVKVLKDTTATCSSNRKKEGQTVEVMIHNF